MGNFQVFTVFLTDGTSISFHKTYNYFDKGSIIEKIENSSDDDVVCFINSAGEEILIPKKKILFIKISPEDPDDDTKEAV